VSFGLKAGLAHEVNNPGTIVLENFKPASRGFDVITV